MAKIKLYKNYWDIVILPPPNICDTAILLSDKLSRRFDGKFVLGKRRFLPHISLYHIPIRNQDLLKIQKVLKEVVSRARFGELDVKLEKVPGWSTVCLGVNSPSWLKRLHMKIVKATEKFRDKGSRVEKTWSGKFSKLHYRNIQRYGSPFVGSAFYPHITLNSLKREMTSREVAEFMRLAQFKSKRFKVDSISVCRLGPSRTCHEISFTIRK